MCSKTIMGTLIAFMAGSLFAATSRSLADSPLPLTDNTAPPYMGLYEGVPKGGGITQVDDYAKWLNRTLVWGHGSEGWDNWNSVERANWLFVPWGAWVQAMPGRRVVLSIPIMPWSPKEGTPYTLKEGAAGAYNDHFTALGKSLVSNHMENSIIRLGWEFDGGWYPWKVLNPTDAASFAQFFQQVVTTMRAVPGLEKLEFCWNGAGDGNRFPLETAYPGGDYVNYVGLDIYDKTWAKDTYPVPPDATPSQTLDREKAAWQVLYKSKHGIKEWMDFAASHKKPFMIPEWGLWSPKNHGGGDDPYFVQQMYEMIQDPASNVYEAAYWDSREAKVTPMGVKASQYPESAALFQRLFSLPASNTKPAP